jgi:soluble lytic murein transglycosylase-like protein
MKKLISIILGAFMIFIFNIPFDNATSLANSDFVKITKNVDYYSNYWYNHYQLYKRINPMTGKKLKRKELEDMVYRQIWQESRFHVDSKTYEPVLHCYSWGLMSLVPSTAVDDGCRFNRPEDLLDIKTNIKYGIKHLYRQIVRYHGNLEKAVAAYNAGGAYKVFVCNNGICTPQYINQRYINIVCFNTKKL